MVLIGGVGVGKGLNDSSVPTEQGIYDLIQMMRDRWREGQSEI